MAQILLVERDADLRNAQAVALGSAGHRVAAAASFEAARQALAERSPDVLITAVHLGAFNGLHLIIRARSARPALLAILTAPTPDPILEGEARANGALLLTNPADTAQLISLVGNVQT